MNPKKRQLFYKYRAGMKGDESSGLAPRHVLQEHGGNDKLPALLVAGRGGSLLSEGVDNFLAL